MIDPLFQDVLYSIKALIDDAREGERAKCVEFVQSYFHLYDDDTSLYEAGLQIARELGLAEWK